MRHILRKTLNITSQPGKLVSHPLKRIFERHYKEKRFARTLFVVDIAVLLAIAISTGLILYFTVFGPPKIIDQVRVDATVAPTDVVSGGLSTLVFRYENTSSEALRFARLQLSFPAHFDLQEGPADVSEVAPQTYDLGTIEPGASGSIKLHGVMFGDVGGEQIFKSDLTFTYGPHDRTATKSSEHVFHPSHSTLVLELVLPEKVVEGQQVQGQIKYKNTGEVDFPEMMIEPVWPSGFSLIHSHPTLGEGFFRLTALKAGQEGVIDFVGQMPPIESTNFVFNPSFTFGEDHYKQESLSQTVTLLPSQIKVTTSFSPQTITPGGTMTVTVNYEHVGELPVSNLKINLDALNQPLFQKSSYQVVSTAATLAPGDKGTASVTLQFNSTMDPRSASTTENLTALVKTYASYAIVQNGIPSAAVNFLTSSDTLKVTSPVILQTFGRYTSPQGDQIGRGPLPPIVGEETKYWVFMTVEGTTNKLENVKMEANLGPGVTFTGKQSVSYGESLDYDGSANAVTWTIGSLPATLSGNQVVSVAFEVALTPTEAMVGTVPTLLSSALITARDTFTGAFITAHGAPITTDLPYDQMATGLGVVSVF